MVCARARGGAARAIIATIALVLLATGCGPRETTGVLMQQADASSGTTDPLMPIESTPQVIASDAYAAQAGVDGQRARIAQLGEVIDDLRSASTSGWQAMQSDEQGYAGEVSGGRITLPGDPVAAARAFLDRYGAAFGPAAEFAFAFEESDGVTTVTADQMVGGIPVDGGALTFLGRDVDSASEISSVAGRVVDTSAVALTPTVTAGQAIDAVERVLDAPGSGDPELVVASPNGAGVLAWAVNVPSGPSESPSLAARTIDFPAVIFVDASTGELVSARSLAEHRRPASTKAPSLALRLALPPAGRPIVISRTLANGMVVKANVERLPRGAIAMVDATGPNANRATQAGLIVALDHSRAEGPEDPGPVAVYASPADVPDDAMLAMHGVRAAMDYYAREMGRLSFDGRNSAVPIVIGYTEGDECLDNAFFLTAPGLSHMAVGIPCVSEGSRLSNTWADPATMGHELTHGVTNSSDRFANRTDLIQTAIDEGNSDYFGVLIANQILGRVSTTGSSIDCYRLSSVVCRKFPNGDVGIRSVDTGATMDDFARVLSDPLGAESFGDDGHDNSMVWTNALWQARKSIAALDGGDLLNSARAKVFDRAVHIGTSRYLTGDADFTDAAAVVQRAGREVGLTATEQNIVADRFRMSGICPSCRSQDASLLAVATNPRLQSRPAVAGSRVAFVEFTGSLASTGKVTGPDGVGVVDLRPRQTLSVLVAARGNWVAQTLYAPASETETLGLMNVATGTAATIARGIDSTVQPGLGATGIAWAGGDERAYYRGLLGGRVSSVDVDSGVARIATDDGLVAILSNDGELLLWNPADGALDDIAGLTGARVDDEILPRGGLVMWGQRIAVIEDPQSDESKILVYNLARGEVTTLDAHAVGSLGLAMNGNLVVWTSVTGSLPGLINELAEGANPDLTLVGYSISADDFGTLVDPAGQQGFPALSDEMAAWQDSQLGGNDIFAVRLGD